MPPILRRPIVPGTLAFFAALIGAGAGLAAPRVAVDIAPVHSIVARVMEGVDAPGLILRAGTSPHDYALRPSDAALIDGADVVVWVGPNMTPWMDGPIDALAGRAKVLMLDEAPGVTLLPARDAGPFEPDHHEGEGPEEAARPEGHEGAHGLDGMDGHVWLDPANAAAFAQAVAATLTAADPEHAAVYEANAAAFGAETTALSDEISSRLAPARGKPFLVFHDAYQYFEKRFDLPAAGSLALTDGEAPGAARIADLRARIGAEGVVCAFAEPSFDPKLIETVIEGSAVRAGTLDPEGIALTPGPDLYPALMRGLAESLADCLAPKPE